MNYEQLYDLFLLALCIWREARNQTLDAKLGVAYTVINRVNHPSWWGTDIISVILKPFQFSSFNRNDPNAIKLPVMQDLSWVASLDAANDAINRTKPDPTNGATYYHDNSIEPPSWVKEATFLCQIDSLLFYR